jgi:elongation factor P--(R)-beta-lysine ligase
MAKSDNSDDTRWQTLAAGGLTRAEILARRHVIRRAVRQWLDANGFLEIDTPLLVQGSTPDAHIDPFAMNDRYLVTSTEYQIKRMIAGGFGRLYTLTQNFREGDLGALNNPEFTMLEWARAGATLEDIEADAEHMVVTAADSLGIGTRLDYLGHEIDLRRPWQKVSVAQAMSETFGLTVSRFDRDTLRNIAEAGGQKLSASMWDDESALFSAVIVDVQSRLGFDRPVFLRDWPSFQTSTAPAKRGGEFTERSELVIAGVELADGFPFQVDAEAQSRASEQQLARRRAMNVPPIELDHRYVAMLKRGLKPGAGMALGFDRLVLLLTGQTALRSVLAFAWDEA